MCSSIVPNQHRPLDTTLRTMGSLGTICVSDAPPELSWWNERTRPHGQPTGRAVILVDNGARGHRVDGRWPVPLSRGGLNGSLPCQDPALHRCLEDRHTSLSFAPPVLATRGPPVALGYVTMTLHKLSAGRGTGYEYLTRQLALDSTEKGTTPPAHYYAAKGETPGHWVGSGRVGTGRGRRGQGGRHRDGRGLASTHRAAAGSP